MLRIVLLIASLSFALPSLASAQRAVDRASLELSFSHGLAQLREPDEQTMWAGGTAALDLRLHAPDGWGGMLRAGTTFGRMLTVEIDLGPTYRGWLYRNGPRGLELGGGVVASLLWNAWGRRLGVESTLLGGLGAAVQLDYREHGFFVGIGYLARWLPFGNDAVDTFSLAATIRVGGEVSL